MLDIKVTPDEGEAFDLKADSRDIANWERTNNGVSFGKLANDPKMIDLYKIAWFAAKRLGHLKNVSADEFQNAYTLKVDFESAGWGENEENPTQTTASPGA